MIGQAGAFAVVFGGLFGARLALCSVVAAQAAGEVRILGSHWLGRPIGGVLIAGWFVGLAMWFLAIAVFGGLALFGLTP